MRVGIATLAVLAVCSVMLLPLMLPPTRLALSQRAPTVATSAAATATATTTSTSGVVPLPMAARDSYNCASSRFVRRVDERPFARGFSKSAWRVYDERDGASARRRLAFVAKTPIERDAPGDERSSREREDAFRDGAVRELQIYRSLAQRNASEFLVKLLGECLDDDADSSQLALFVRGPLLRWATVVRDQRLVWCVRVQLAYSLALLLRVLDEQRLVHCDWKTDQIAIEWLADDGSLVVPAALDDDDDRFDDVEEAAVAPPLTRLHVRLVDLKSLTGFTNEHKVGARTRCASDDDCVQACFRWQHDDARFDVVDYECDRARRQCVGLDTTSMIFATEQLFLRELLDPLLNATDNFIISNNKFHEEFKNDDDNNNNNNDDNEIEHSNNKFALNDDKDRRSVNNNTTNADVKSFVKLLDDLRYVRRKMSVRARDARMTTRRLVEKLGEVVRTRLVERCLTRLDVRNATRRLLRESNRARPNCKKKRFC